MTDPSTLPAPDTTPGDRGRPRDWTGTLYGRNRRTRQRPGGGCVLCAQRAAVWDHCHRHGTIRGPLCARCNRIVADLDAGTGAGFAPRWVDAWPCGRHSELDARHYRPADELLTDSTHGPEAYRAHLDRCPECVRAASVE